jgi:hypothetical protein
MNSVCTARADRVARGEFSGPILGDVSLDKPKWCRTILRVRGALIRSPLSERPVMADPIQVVELILLLKVAQTVLQK